MTTGPLPQQGPIPSEITETVAAQLAADVLHAGAVATTEQDLLVAVEHALGPVLDQLGIPRHVEYEKVLLHGRADSVYGSVIIEYEAPGKLATVPGRAEAFGQVRQYAREQAEIRSPGAPEEALPKLVGVVLDGQQIGFVVWRPGAQPDVDLFDLRLVDAQLSLDVEEEIAGRFQQLGPFPVTAASITDLLRFLRGLSRRPLEASALAEEFGPDGQTAKIVVQALHGSLAAPSSRTRTLHAEWLRLFGAIYGDQGNVSRKGVRALAQTYELEPGTDVGRMLFAVHTYFALIMKVLARELVALQAGAVIEPLIVGLPALPDAEFEHEFQQLEDGSTFRALGIENFLEGDFLGWYTHEWTPELRAAVRRLVSELGDYEPGTASLRPELTQDLLKELYHGLLPRDLRHSLGEFYTPDWLAEYTLDRAEYTGRPEARMLDPACGSGTFLVLAIRRMKEAGRALGQSPEEVARAITAGIVGFDLNPLAVIAARTNYLLAAGDLVGAIAPFRIPVFICDSITGVHSDGDELPTKRLHTSVGDFVLPSAVVSSTLLPAVMADLEFCAETGLIGSNFEDRLRQSLPALGEEDRGTMRELFEQICQLKAEGRDGIWPRLLTNAFAPLFARGQFDHVIGNPPWINWEEVSADYRAATQPLWVRYGLYTLAGAEARLGGGKKDMSMLMTYVAAEEYLRPNGRLTFLVTQTALQTTGAGDGFRHFGNDRVSFSGSCAVSGGPVNGPGAQIPRWLRDRRAAIATPMTCSASTRSVAALAQALKGAAPRLAALGPDGPTLDRRASLRRLAMRFPRARKHGNIC